MVYEECGVVIFMLLCTFGTAVTFHLTVNSDNKSIVRRQTFDTAVVSYYLIVDCHLIDAGLVIIAMLAFLKQQLRLQVRWEERGF